MFASTDHFDAAILIVDDLLSNVRLLEHTLRRAGYAASTSTTNPREVLSLHQKSRYALVMLDLQMPVMDGFAVMKALQELDTHDRPAILVMSADPSQWVPALEAGATDFLAKPCVLSDVVRLVHEILEHSVLRLPQVLPPAAA